MKKKLFIKTYILICSILAIANITYAQSSIIDPSNILVEELDTEQAENYEILSNNPIYQTLTLCTVNEIREVNEDGYVYLIGSYGDCGSYAFDTYNFEDIDEDNYKWNGDYFIENPESGCESGTFYLIKREGLFIGHISLDDRSFELFDLSNGLQVLCEMDPEQISETDCEVEGGDEVELSAIPCDDGLAKILVLYTAEALAAIPNGILGIYLIADIVIYQTNMIWQKSHINENLVALAGIEFLDFTETNSISADINTLAGDNDVHTLRDDKEAEIVMLLAHGDDYLDGYGRVVKNGGAKEHAYGIARIGFAFSGKYVFAHEVNHIYGALHDDSQVPGYAHGYVFSGNRTLMAVATPLNAWRIDHVSNPDVYYNLTSTGTYSYNNNARKVSEFNRHVNSFYTDFPLFTAVLSVTNPEDCEATGTASVEADCGTPPYTYAWYKSLSGFSPWTAFGGSTSSVNYTIVVPQYTYMKQQGIKVVITDANSNVQVKQTTAVYYCPDDHPRESIEQEEAKVEIYPNPSNGQLSLIAIKQKLKNTSIELYDSYGKLLSVDKINSSLTSCDLDYSKLSKGLYILKVKNDKFNCVEKIIIN